MNSGHYKVTLRPTVKRTPNNGMSQLEEGLFESVKITLLLILLTILKFILYPTASVCSVTLSCHWFCIPFVCCLFMFITYPLLSFCYICLAMSDVWCADAPLMHHSLTYRMMRSRPGVGRVYTECNVQVAWHSWSWSTCDGVISLHAQCSRVLRCAFDAFTQGRTPLVMAALWNRAGHYIFALWFLSSFFLSSSFFPRLISAVGDWMSAILPHMMWP